MADDTRDGNHGLDTGSFADDAPTERIALSSVNTETNPTVAGVIDPTLAASIRAGYEPTVTDEDRLTFVVIVDDEGRMLVPENLWKAGAIKPGDELLIQAQKIN